MVDIEVEYESFPARAKVLEDYGKKIYDDFLMLYRSIEELNISGAWKGKKYSEFASFINNFIDGFNGIVLDTMQKIPQIVREAGTNYWKLDDPEGYGSCGTSPTASHLEPLNIPDDTTIFFNSTAISNAKDNVVAKLKDAITVLENYKSYVSGMNDVWSGEAYEDLMGKINAYESKVTTDLDSIETAFKNLLDGIVTSGTGVENTNTD